MSQFDKERMFHHTATSGKQVELGTEKPLYPSYEWGAVQGLFFNKEEYELAPTERQAVEQFVRYYRAQFPAEERERHSIGRIRAIASAWWVEQGFSSYDLHY